MLEKRKHFPLLLEIPKAKTPKRDINPMDFINIIEEGNQIEEVKENLHGQGSGGSGGRRSTCLAKVSLKDNKGKQKMFVIEEDLGYEEFEA